MKTENSTERAPSFWWPLLLLVAIALPLLLLFLMPARTSGSVLAIVFVVLVLFNLAVVWLLLKRTPADAQAQAEAKAGPRMLTEEEIPPVVQEVMAVQMAMEEDGVQIFRGALREAAENAFQRLKTALGGAWLPLLQQDQQMGTAIFLMPGSLEEKVSARQSIPWLNWVLFALTFLTTTWAGALYQGVNLLNEPGQFAVGLPYSIALLAILGLHELGHYFTARHYKMNVTPPYFIPVPFALGTFGAFIQMRSPPEDRRSLFDVAVAGPLAGLVLAIPALFFGLQTSTIGQGGLHQANSFLGGAISGSILFTLVAKAALGAKLTENTILQLSPLAFAGWLGLLVTALNLLPIGQLDGGHVARAIFGSRAGSLLSRAAMWTLLLLAIFVWPSLLFWAIVVFFIARRGSPPLNDLTPVSPGRRWLGIFTFLILASILAPMPKAFW